MIKMMFFILASLSLAACNPATQEETKADTQAKRIERVDSEKFEAMLLEYPNAQLIDVRTAQEFESGHLENAVNLNYYDPSFKRSADELKKDEPVFVYCAVGGRSASAAKVLQEQGFTHIIDLAGGITDWKRSGKPVK